MNQHMPEGEEAEFKVMTKNMYDNGGTENVLDCLISMMESQLVIARKLKEIVRECGKK